MLVWLIKARDISMAWIVSFLCLQQRCVFDILGQEASSDEAHQLIRNMPMEANDISGRM